MESALCSSSHVAPPTPAHDAACDAGVCVAAAAAAERSHCKAPGHAGARIPCSGELRDPTAQTGGLHLVWGHPRQPTVALLQSCAACSPRLAKHAWPASLLLLLCDTGAACLLPLQLGASLRELSALGMRKDQVSAAILNCPAVTKYTCALGVGTAAGLVCGRGRAGLGCAMLCVTSACLLLDHLNGCWVHTPLNAPTGTYAVPPYRRQQMAATLMSVGLDLSTAPMNVLQVGWAGHPGRGSCKIPATTHCTVCLLPQPCSPALRAWLGIPPTATPAPPPRSVLVRPPPPAHS